jgi:two-component system response regulator NreC
MNRIRVAIADDHAMLRAGLKLLVNSQADMEMVGEAGNHADTRELVRNKAPAVLILDLSMPGGQPMKLIEELSRVFPETRVLVLTMHEDPAYARMALAAGASGFVLKRSADSDLLQAIRAVARGGIFAHMERKSPECPKAASASVAELSDREREILLGIARGFTNQALADQLFLSVKTVESYRARMMAKLGLKNRAEVTHFAISSGLLESE